MIIVGVCVGCGARLDIPDNLPSDKDKEGKGFADFYCVKCLARRPKQEVIINRPIGGPLSWR